MGEMLSVAMVYLLALIGLAFLVVVIVVIYVAYHYDISFKIGKSRDRKPAKGGDNGKAQTTPEADHSKARQ